MRVVHVVRVGGRSNTFETRDLRVLFGTLHEVLQTTQQQLYCPFAGGKEKASLLLVITHGHHIQIATLGSLQT